MENSIPEFYAGKTVLITGATGFMGKVLVEKLLRSCPDIKEIYILIRDKRGQTASQRWEELTKLAVFDKVKKERPGNLESKVIVLNGEVEQTKLGLDDEIYEKLKQKVSIIFHVAATVRFTEPIDIAVKCNVTGTKNVIDFGSEAKNLKVLVHVSTAYSNCYLKQVEEKIYPPIFDWKQAVKITKTIDSSTLQILTPKFVDPMVNTYTFTKHLAEQVVKEARKKIPLVILRPSIVISSWKEPEKGWVDNENGPMGILIGIGKGVIRTTIADVHIRPDYMAVDVAIKALIVAAWKKGTSKKDRDKVEVINASSTSKSITLTEMYDIGMVLNLQYPMKKMLWYPRVQITTNLNAFRIMTFFLHFIPALVIDTGLELFNQKPLLMKVHKKYIAAMSALSYFLVRQWTFSNDNFLSLVDAIPDKCKKDFDFSFENVDPYEFFKWGMINGQKFLMNETVDDFDDARKKLKRMYYLDIFVKSVVAVLILYPIYLWYL